MAFLDTLIFGYRQIVDGSNVLLLQRNRVKFVGAGSVVDDVANAQTVVTLTGNSSLGADGSGYSNVTGRIHDTSNAKVDGLYYNINQTNGSASPTTLLTIPTQSNKGYSIRGIVSVQSGTMSAYGEWEVNCYVLNAAGVLTLVGTAVTQKANVGSFVITFTVSGTNLIATGTDPGSGRRWTGQFYVAERSF